MHQDINSHIPSLTAKQLVEGKHTGIGAAKLLNTVARFNEHCSEIPDINAPK